MLLKISRIYILIISILSFPFIFYITVLVGAAGHAMPNDNEYLQILGYSVIVSILTYYSNRFYKIFWFYRFLIKMALIVLLLPMLYFAIMILYDSFFSHSYWLAYLLIVPISLLNLVAGIIFIFGIVSGRLKIE